MLSGLLRVHESFGRFSRHAFAQTGADNANQSIAEPLLSSASRSPLPPQGDRINYHISIARKKIALRVHGIVNNNGKLK